ncbi:LbetaH domain-containing protein [Tenacibaculum jejuense]|uniref:DapH/DapD/GlmU-related protein n=1 Tax=Tenacibaculum jejuense TaxID=584609 RepID=UPI002936E0FC|nr:DapH/DapD/GlmU-related protein [Tenacibaculum jejuense]
MFFNRSRLIRFPIIIRGRKSIDFGKGLTTGIGCRIEAYPDKLRNDKLIVFGDNVQLNDYVHITAMNKVVIGNNVLMASKIYISDCSHGFYEGGERDSSPESIPIDREYKINFIVIEDNVWLGEFVSVLPGVRIGKGSIIGANSVVTKDIPSNSIAIGVPAKVIKKFNLETKKWEKI